MSVNESELVAANKAGGEALGGEVAKDLQNEGGEQYFFVGPLPESWKIVFIGRIVCTSFEKSRLPHAGGPSPSLMAFKSDGAKKKRGRGVCVCA